MDVAPKGRDGGGKLDSCIDVEGFEEPVYIVIYYNGAKGSPNERGGILFMTLWTLRYPNSESYYRD